MARDSEPKDPARRALRKMFQAVEDMADAAKRAEEARRELLKTDTPTRYVRIHKPANGQEGSDVS